MPEQMNMFIPITKVNEQRREVWGWAAIEEPDNSDEILDYESSKPHFLDWSNRAQKRSGGKSLGNVRSMHQNVAAGKLIELRPDDVSKGFYVGAKIIDDNEWKKVEQGVYTGFSVGGSYLKRWNDFRNPGKMRYTAKPTELSIVDSPCIPSATFEMLKADGSKALRKFQPAQGKNMIKVVTRTILVKYDPNEARDSSGRWTDSGGGGGGKAPKPDWMKQPRPEEGYERGQGDNFGRGGKDKAPGKPNWMTNPDLNPKPDTGLQPPRGKREEGQNKYEADPKQSADDDTEQSAAYPGYEGAARNPTSPTNPTPKEKSSIKAPKWKIGQEVMASVSGKNVGAKVVGHLPKDYPESKQRVIVEALEGTPFMTQKNGVYQDTNRAVFFEESLRRKSDFGNAPVGGKEEFNENVVRNAKPGAGEKPPNEWGSAKYSDPQATARQQRHSLFDVIDQDGKKVIMRDKKTGDAFAVSVREARHALFDEPQDEESRWHIYDAGDSAEAEGLWKPGESRDEYRGRVKQQVSDARNADTMPGMKPDKEITKGDVMNRLERIYAILDDVEEELKKADVPESPEPISDIPLKGEFGDETVEQMPAPNVLMEIEPNSEPSQEVLASHTVKSEDLTKALEAWLPKVGKMVKSIVAEALAEATVDLEKNSAPARNIRVVKDK